MLSELAHARPSKVIDLESDDPQPADSQRRQTSVNVIDSPPRLSSSKKRVRTSQSSSASRIAVKEEPLNLGPEVASTFATAPRASAQPERRIIKQESIDIDAMDDIFTEDLPAPTIKENSVEEEGTSLRRAKFKEEVNEVADMSRCEDLYTAEEAEPEHKQSQISEDEVLGPDKIEEEEERRVELEVDDFFRLEEEGLIGDY